MRLTIFKRLMLGYLAFLVLLIGLGVYVAAQLNRLNQLTWAVVMQDGETVRLAEALDSMTVSLTRFEKKHLITQDKAFFERFQELRADYLKTHQSIDSHIAKDELQVVVNEIGVASDTYFTIVDRERELMGAQGGRLANIDQDRKADLIDRIRLSLQTIMGQARQARDRKILESSRISVEVIRIGIFTIGVGGVIGLLISFFSARQIRHAIHRLQHKTHEVANGRFARLSSVASPPEIATLTRDFNRMCARLEELNGMKEDFIYHVSHELRTPLTAIREASSMLLEGCFDNRAEHQNQLLTIVKGECERLIQSINRMLDLSRMEAQMMAYDFQPTDLPALVRECLLKLAPIALSKNIQLELKPSDALPPVKADPERIRQLLDNLLGNALKYTDAGGRVWIILQRETAADGFLRVEIHDTGRGIQQDDLKSIFDKFHRIDRGQDTERGTGLGLSIAKHTVMAHGGNIWATSRPEKGSVFAFTLPVV